VTTDETRYLPDEAVVAGSIAVLSPQQQRVLEQVALGMTNKRIAKILGITPRTVHFHLSAAFRKLQVRGRLCAAVAFLELQGTSGSAVC
jgi:two-component system, NarL family, nitrate/nitrite response regulator NarL